MRFSEAAGLRWGDLDLDAGTVTLRENKTDDPRTWALAPGVADALRTWRVMRIDGKPADHVFTDEHARPLTNEHHAETFRRHLLAAGVTREALFGSGKGSAPIRLHDLGRRSSL
jgi:integrase